MTQFELFCALLYLLEDVCLDTGGKLFQESGFKDDNVQNEELRLFLSDINP